MSHEQRLKKLYRERGITPASCGEFLCAYKPECMEAHEGSPYRTGSWTYVGQQYGEALIQGRPKKILFIGMDAGGTGDLSTESFDETREGYRNGCQFRGNAHMGGVASVMAAMVDADDPAEYSQQMALANLVKCVALTGRMESTATRRERANCSEHFAAEVACLSPDLIIQQGSVTRGVVKKTLGLAGEPTRSVRAVEGKRGQAGIYVKREHIVLTIPHSRIGGWGWKSGTLPSFLKQTIEVTKELLAART